MHPKKMMSLIMTFVFAGLVVLLSANYALAAQPVATVNGGGIAAFDPGEELAGEVTEFSVGAHLHADGTATGHFNCVIAGFATIVGDVQNGTIIDGNTVYLSGKAMFTDQFDGNPPLIEREEDFNVTLTAGGPGEGHFLYVDKITGPAGDAETVVTGQINIKID